LLARHDAEEADLPELVHDCPVEFLPPERLQHPRHQLVLGERPGAVADHPLLLRELVLDVEGILPVEGCKLRVRRCLLLLDGFGHDIAPLFYLGSLAATFKPKA
jgi:hypothetical protein